MNHLTYTGSCLCGAVRYEASHLSERIGHCHCTMCRKFHGAAFATFGEAPVQHFHWLSGENLLQSYHADNGTTRRFCKQCGASLTFESQASDGKYIEFSLATLDSRISERPDAHIYTAYKANWCHINDDLPKYLEGRQHAPGQIRNSHDD